LQQSSRTGCIGSVDKKLAGVEMRSTERRKRFAMRVQIEAAASSQHKECAPAVHDVDNGSSDSSSENDDEHDEFVMPVAKRSCDGKQIKPKPRKDIISARVSAVLDRTNTSIRTSTMILASVVNEVGGSTSAAVLSKSTIHRKRQICRREASKQIKEAYVGSKSVIHWDGKLLPNVTGNDSCHVDRLPVLISALHDGSTKLLGVPKLSSGSGQAAAQAVHELLISWHCESLVVGMCFDTTASNTGRVNGACILLEASMGRHLLWLACRHHMFEVLLSDAFRVCFGPSSGPEITIFKRFRESWSKLVHHMPKKYQSPLIIVPDSLKTFIVDHSDLSYPRDDYREFLCLVASMVGIETKKVIRKPGALHRHDGWQKPSTV